MLAFRCPEHGVIAAGEFAERLERATDTPSCPHLVQRQNDDGKTRPEKCGLPLTRHEGRASTEEG